MEYYSSMTYDSESEASASSVNDNDIKNHSGKRRMNYHEVDEYAHELNSKYGGGKDYFKFYCKAIWVLGTRRVRELEGKVSDAKYQGRMLSKLIKDELMIAESRNRNNDSR